MKRPNANFAKNYIILNSLFREGSIHCLTFKMRLILLMQFSSKYNPKLQTDVIRYF